jgi:hypothetical protein
VVQAAPGMTNRRSLSLCCSSCERRFNSKFACLAN